MNAQLIALTASVALFAATVHADPPNPFYVDQQHRTIKAMSADDIDGHLQGLELDYAKTAELNHFPGPTHLRELADDLHLSAEVRMRIKRIEDDERTQARALGQQIVQWEQQLDSMFAHATVDPELVSLLTARIGTARGELRAVHLTAHLHARPLLSAAQVARYDELRGYTQDLPPGIQDGKNHPHGH